jgi:ABC-2 type transport system permease protein
MTLSPGAAALLFGRIKLRLIVNGFRVGWQAIVGIVVGAVFALPPALAGAIGLAILPRSAPEAAEIVVPLVCLLLFVGWSLGPIFAFGTDETLDPSRLALLPLRPAQLMAGLFAASSIGIAPSATILLLVGLAIGMAPASLGALIVVAAVAAHFLLCIAAGRALTTGLSALLRTRKMRDLTMMLVVLVSMTFGLGVQFVARFAARADLGDSLGRGLDVLMYTPPGLAARAALAAREGDLLAALAALTGLVACVLALAWLWWRNLSRITTRPESGSTASGRARSGVSPGLFAGPLRLLPRNRVGATAAAQLRLLWRDPRTRAAYLGMLIIGVMGVAAAIVIPEAGQPKLVFAVLFLAWLGSVGALNQYGYDGRAYWMLAVSDARPDDDLAGRNLALIAIGMTIVLLLTIVLSALTGGWLYGLAVICLSAAVIGAMVAAGNLTSVMAPQPQPEASGNLWAMGNTGGGVTAGLGQMAALLATGIALAPLAIGTLVGLFAWPPALAIAAVAAPPYGLLLVWLSRRYASRWINAHQPELLAALNPRRNP